MKRKLRSWGVVEDDVELEFFCTMHAAANRATGLLQRNPPEVVRDGNLGNAMGYRERAFYCKKQDLQFYPPKNRPWEDTRGQLLLGLFDYMRNNLLDPLDEADVRQRPSYDDLRDKFYSLLAPSLVAAHRVNCSNPGNHCHITMYPNFLSFGSSQGFRWRIRSRRM